MGQIIPSAGAGRGEDVKLSQLGKPLKTKSPFNRIISVEASGSTGGPVNVRISMYTNRSFNKPVPID